MLNVPFSIRLVNKEELDEIARKQPAMLANLRAKYSEDKYGNDRPGKAQTTPLVMTQQI